MSSSHKYRLSTAAVHKYKTYKNHSACLRTVEKAQSHLIILVLVILYNESLASVVLPDAIIGWSCK